MIISASFRTDLPAFYGNWFERRLDAGYCLVKNPYNNKFHHVGLRRQDVDGFFFWTKNLGPFLPQLAVLKERGYPFIIHYSITGYPRELEYSVARAEKAVEQLKLVSREYGARRAVWRYDPILVTSITDLAFHRENFTRLAESLAGFTDEVVVSFAQFFQKTQRNLNRAAQRFGFHWKDPSDDCKRAFLQELSTIAHSCGMRLSLCAQPQYLAAGIAEASCIDVARLSDVSKIPVKEKKPGHRGKQCACNQSRDIGAYDTCPHGCFYCYAVADRRAAKAFFREHDPMAEWLRGPRRLQKKKQEEDLPLFCWERQGKKSCRI